MIVRSPGEIPIALAGARLYGAPGPIGLGSRSVGEWANEIVGMYFEQGIVRKMAGALEAADSVIAEARSRGLAGLGVLPLAIAATGLKIAPIALNISSILGGISASKRAARVKKNSKNGNERAEKNYLDPSKEEYQNLAGALAELGIPVPEQASSAYYANLLKEIGYKPYKRSLGKRSQRDPYGKFRSMMQQRYATLAGIVQKLKAASAPAPATGALPVLSPVASVPAPAVATGAVVSAAPISEDDSMEEGASSGAAVQYVQQAAPSGEADSAEKESSPWLPAGIALLALKLFGG